MADDVAEPRGEGQAPLDIDRHLIDPVQLVLHGVLDRDHLDRGGVDPLECGVERRRLATPGGSGHQHDPIGLVEAPLEAHEHLVGHAEVLQVDQGRALVQDSHDHRLAVHGRDRGHAEVDLALLGRKLDAPVLGHKPLGDVHVGHDLDPRDDGRMEPLGGRALLNQETIDAVLDLEFVLKRLDVDIAGAVLDGLQDDQVDQVDQGRLPSDLTELGRGQVLALQGAIAVLVLGGQVVQHPGHVAAVEPQDGGVHLDRVSVVPSDGTTGHDPQVFHGLGLKRVDHGHGQPPVLIAQGKDLVPVDKVRGDQADDLRADGDVVQIHPLNPGLKGKGLLKLGLRDVTQLDEDHAELAVSHLLLLQCDSQVPRLQVGLLAEQLTQSLPSSVIHSVPLALLLNRPLARIVPTLEPTLNHRPCRADDRGSRLLCPLAHPGRTGRAAAQDPVSSVSWRLETAPLIHENRGALGKLAHLHEPALSRWAQEPRLHGPPRGARQVRP